MSENYNGLCQNIKIIGADNSKRGICLLFIFKLIFEESTGESVVLCNLGFCGIILTVGALELAILSAVVYKSFGRRFQMTNRFYDEGTELNIFKFE